MLASACGVVAYSVALDTVSTKKKKKDCGLMVRVLGCCAARRIQSHLQALISCILFAQIIWQDSGSHGQQSSRVLLESLALNYT